MVSKPSVSATMECIKGAGNGQQLDGGVVSLSMSPKEGNGG